MRQKVGDDALISSSGGAANSGGGDDDASPNSDKGDNPSHSPNHDGAIGDDTASDGGNRPSRRHHYRSWRPRFSERRRCHPPLRPGRRSLRDRVQGRGLPLKVHFAFISPGLTASTYDFASATRDRPRQDGRVAQATYSECPRRDQLRRSASDASELNILLKCAGVSLGYLRRTRLLCDGHQSDFRLLDKRQLNNARRRKSVARPRQQARASDSNSALSDSLATG